ncbi:MAG: hypothetical protein JST00_45015 [Deltaproteobacteria bacterium]|nr:hypothetical protein [Deltaproteobacteria bacterium]
MRSSRAFIGLGLLAVSLLSALAGASCSSFSDEPNIEARDADLGETGSETSTGDASLQDGPAIDGEAGVPSCAPRGTTKDLASPMLQKIYNPPSPTFPFGLATDATHVTWAEQSEDVDGGTAYEGVGRGRILRVAKTGGPAAVIATDQELVIAVAVAGGFVYWGAGPETASELRRRPVGTDCNATFCPAPESVATFDRRIVDIRVIRESVFLVMLDNGKVSYVDLATKTSSPLVTTFFYPGLAVTSSHLYASSEVTNAALLRATIAPNPVIEVNYLKPAIDGGNPGVGRLATDCRSLFMSHYTSFVGSKIYAHDFDRPGSFDLVVDTKLNIDQMVADEGNVWVSAANGGLFAGSRTSTSLVRVFQGNVFRAAVDDDAVYFGDHNPVGTERGTIYRLLK